MNIRKKYKKIDDNVSKLTEEAKSEIKKITDKSDNDQKIQELKEEYYKAIEKTDNIKQKIIQNLEDKADEIDNKEGFTILGIKPWKILAYFVIYSFLGFCIETLYGAITKGVFESRQSFLYGPFCGIYGLGAVVMILSLQFFTKNNYLLFLGGCVVGSIIEYIVSLVGELLFHVRWWDYSSEPLNINGRICLFYAIIWGILAVWLLKSINPKVDDFITWAKKKLPKYLLPIVVNSLGMFLLFDSIVSMYAMNVFYSRLAYDYDIDIVNKSSYIENYEQIMNDTRKSYISNKYFSNEKILKTYPNLKYEDTKGNSIFIREILTDIQPYYYKFFTPKDDK